MLRALGLILIGFGLFVQSAAHASALPQEPTMVEGHCDEMLTSVPQDRNDKSPCDELGINCLVALGCIPPLAMGNDVSEVRALPATRLRFADFGSSTPGEAGVGPEPPPPQAGA